MRPVTVILWLYLVISRYIWLYLAISLISHHIRDGFCEVSVQGRDFAKKSQVVFYFTESSQKHVAGSFHCESAFASGTTINGTRTALDAICRTTAPQKPRNRRHDWRAIIFSGAAYYQLHLR